MSKKNLIIFKDSTDINSIPDTRICFPFSVRMVLCIIFSLYGYLRVPISRKELLAKIDLEKEWITILFEPEKLRQKLGHLEQFLVSHFGAKNAAQILDVQQFDR